MKRLIVGEKELFVNDYPVASVSPLGFDFTYLYYEPEVPNLFKIVTVGEHLVRVDLTDSEKIACSSYCDSYVPEVVEDDETPLVEDPIIYFVNTISSSCGSKSRSQLGVNEIEITHDQIETRGFVNSVIPEYVWDNEQNKFVGKTYRDKRAYAYYSELKYGDQLAAIWKFIEQYVNNGGTIPDETQTALDKINSIKAENPKA